MFSQASSSQHQIQLSAHTSGTSKSLTEEKVLHVYLPCIPDAGEVSNIYDVMKKCQQQYQYQYQQQQLQQQMKKSSEQLEEDKEQPVTNNTFNSNQNQQFTLNTPHYTKLVIDKIVGQLAGPADDLDVQLHILHMRQLAQEQEKTIQRAMIEGDKSKFNRKACEFAAIEREQPQKFCAEYYEQQLQLQQQYINYSSNSKQSSESHPSSPYNSYSQYNRDSLCSPYEQNQRLLNESSNNVLQSRCSNISYSTNTTSTTLHPKTSLNNAQAPVNIISNESTKQNNYPQQYSYQQQPLISQSQSVQQQNTVNTNQSSHKNNKENKVSTQSAGKENAGTSMGIINSKISKDSRNKKRAQTQIRQQSSQNAQLSSNNSANINNNTPAAIPQLSHQQQSAPAVSGQGQQQMHSMNQQVHAVQAPYNGYPIHQNGQQIYNNQFGYRTVYSAPPPPMYYNQPAYNNPNPSQIYQQNNCSPYYYPQPNHQRNSSNYSSQQCFNNNQNNNNNTNQSFFAKQEGYIEENADITSQIESPLIEMSNSSNHNNHSLHQSNYEDFFRNQDQDQQLPLQPHISQQNQLQQNDLEDDLENAEVDDMINNYLS